MAVAPGLVDVHVHFRDPGLTYKEDILTGAHAAAAGGFTTVVCMANTKPVIDNAETLQYVLNKGKETGIHVLSCACVTKGMQGKELVDMDALRAAGAAGFTDDGIPILDEEVLKAALIKAEELQVPVSLHEEDPKLITNNGINRGPVSEKLGIGGSPAEAEITMVERDCRLAEETGSYVNIQHISTAGAVEAVRASKRRGSHVTAEAAPHHFTLTDEAVLTYGTLAKMNPPLRTEADRQAVIEGLKDGTIDMIATDHAPHSIDEKGKPLTEAPSGIVGLETSLALGITELVKPGCLTLMELMRKMSQNPAALYHLPYQGIAEGAPARPGHLRCRRRMEARKLLLQSSQHPLQGLESDRPGALHHLRWKDSIQSIRITICEKKNAACADELHHPHKQRFLVTESRVYEAAKCGFKLISAPSPTNTS